MKRTVLRVALILIGLSVSLARPAVAQDGEPPIPLHSFVQQVARFWLEGDAAALVQMLPEEDRILLDTGSGMETANGRHAAAALRALFSESETTAARAVQATVAGASPARGFGELAWTYRPRGAPGEQSRSIYVAARWEGGAWRITELRVMP